MSGSLIPNAKQQFLDANGNPLASGKVYFYIPSTTTFKNTYQDAALTILNTNPIVLDTAGEAIIYGNGSYRQIVNDVNNNLIWDQTTIAPITITDVESVYSASNGASLIGYNEGASGAVNRTVQAKLQESVSVLDFGADSTGSASSLSAFQSAVTASRYVYVPSGTYKLDSQLVINVDGTVLHLASNVTLNISGTIAQQGPPFGNCINILANNCAVIGSGKSSLIQISGNCYANGVGILQKAGLLIRDIAFDGNKTGVTATTDDTFGSAISIIADSGSGATTDVNATIDNCYIKNWTQYGVNVYGNQSNDVKIVNCNIDAIGNSSDSNSVGAGIVVTKGVSDFIVSNNVIKNSKSNGIFVSSAGTTGSNYSITGNNIHQNGESGITFYEAVSYGSISGQGINNIAIAGNVCSGNTRSGVLFNSNTVGFINYSSISGNTLEGNGYAGIELNSTNTSPNIVSYVDIVGNQCIQNTTTNISVGQYVQKVSGYSVSFTPVLSGTSTAGIGTYSSQLGSYMLIGNIVYYQIVLAWSAHTGTGNMQINGFPYLSSATEPQSDAWVFGNGITVTGQLCFNTTSASDAGLIGYINNGTYGSQPIQSTGTLRITGSYIATI
jgi:hypothetical protein